jgi:hypothetical protein
MQIDCATTYSQCYESPYKTILNKVIAKRRWFIYSLFSVHSIFILF